jgi:hypothetical protein
MKRVLFVSIAFSLIALALCFGNVHGTASLGISHYDPHALVGVGDIKDIAVCQVLNAGNETLIIRSTWKQTSGNMSLPVSIKYPNITLEPSASAEVFIVAAGPSNDYMGNYTGEVEITGFYLHPPTTGNPIVPGGTINVWLTVKHLLPADFILYGLNLNETEIDSGGVLHGSITVKNKGEMTGTYGLVITCDGQVLESTGVTLMADQQRTIDFAYTINVSGSHTLSCGNLSQSFFVKALVQGGGFEFPEWALPTLAVIATSGLGMSGGYVVYRKWLKNEKT